MMITLDSRKWCIGLALALGAATAVLAQGSDTPAPVMKNSEVTEDALVDALAIEGPEGTGKTRGFRPATAAGEKPKPYGPGKASLLVTFVTGSSELTDDSRGVLDKLARAMQSDTLAGLSFRVEGHADARGDPQRNQELSLARAESVVAYLSSAHGVLPERLRPVGKGSAEPMNRERVDAPENRRVTIVSSRE